MSLRLIAALVAVGLFAFAALILLMSYADELRSDEPQFATALDTSAVGFAGLSRLLEELDIDSRIDPYAAPGRWDGRSVRLYFPTGGVTEKRMERVPRDHPGIVVLPKWNVSPEEEGATTVVLRSDPGLSNASAQALAAFDESLRVHVSRDIRANVYVEDEPARIRYLQWIEARPDEDAGGEPDEAGSADEGDTSEDDESLEELEREAQELIERFELNRHSTTRSDRSLVELDEVLYRIPGTELLVLADPDLLSNHGISTQDRAEVAVGLLNAAAGRLGVGDPVIVLDDNLRRRDTEQNLVKLLTRPPFLAATLCLLMAGLMIGWQGFNRFGAALGDGAAEDEDRVSSGPAVLATSAGGFIAAAGRIDDVADRFADVVRRQVIEALGLSVWDARRVDAALSDRETLRDITPRFHQIASDPSLTPMIRAERLRRWKEDILK